MFPRQSALGSKLKAAFNAFFLTPFIPGLALSSSSSLPLLASLLILVRLGELVRVFGDEDTVSGGESRDDDATQNCNDSLSVALSLPF